ncbi:hypothetical protein, partial [Hyalangium versicolor]|uniref:hypothetical protein n=1 Tax=Hyalangium versicolor TaxID=2861190 RepID=UPI001CC9BBDF
LAAAVRRFNEGLTQKMDPTTAAVAQARALTPDSVRALGRLLAAGDFTLRELMRIEQDAITRLLERSGIVTRQNRSEWVGAAGALTDHAKDVLEGMFVGLVLATPERIRATPPGILRKLERAVPYLVAVRATLPKAFDLIPSVVAAVDALNDARVRGVSLSDLASQASLFGDGSQLDATAAKLGTMLDELGPRQVGDAFR